MTGYEPKGFSKTLRFRPGAPEAVRTAFLAVDHPSYVSSPLMPSQIDVDREQTRQCSTECQVHQAHPGSHSFRSQIIEAECSHNQNRIHRDHDRPHDEIFTASP